MKKAILVSVVSAVALGFLVGASPVYAGGCTIKNNKGDDSTYLCNVSEKNSTTINVTQNAVVNINSTITANSGNNTISAGGDITNATIESGSASVYSESLIDVNSTYIELKAPSKNEPKVDISGNETDDAFIEANVTQKNTEKINVVKNTTANINETIAANAGGNSITAGGDVKNAKIRPSNATVRSVRTLFVNWTQVKRN